MWAGCENDLMRENWRDGKELTFGDVDVRQFESARKVIQNVWKMTKNAYFQHKTIDSREDFLLISFLRKYVLDKCIWIRNNYEIGVYGPSISKYRRKHQDR